MARPLPLEFAGAFYHVAAWGQADNLSLRQVAGRMGVGCKISQNQTTMEQGSISQQAHALFRHSTHQP